METRLLNDNEFVDLSVPGHYAIYSIPFFSPRSLRRVVDGGSESIEEQINVLMCGVHMAALQSPS